MRRVGTTRSAVISTRKRRSSTIDSIPSPDAARPDPSAHPLLETSGLTRHFRVGGLLSRATLHAVDDVDLVIYPREIVTLVGESGSGKSTVARLLAGVYRPTSGNIRFRG